MRKNELLEYRIKRLEHMIRNHRAVKNEDLSVGRKMFAYDSGLNWERGFYVITDNESLLNYYVEELPMLLYEDGHSERSAAKHIFRNDSVIIIDKPCNPIDQPTVIEYGDFLDLNSEYDDTSLSYLDWDDLVFVDKNNQIHELEFFKYNGPILTRVTRPRYTRR